MIYRLLFKLLLQRLDVERAHALASRTLRLAAAVPPIRGLMRRFTVPHDPSLQVKALGLTFPSPLGVAAGVDKGATWFEGLALLGFGFVEVGTVTANEQPGNPHPRIFRLAKDRALLNKMGFPNPGAEAVAERLRTRRSQPVIGVNVGKSRAAALDDAGEDYRAAARHVAPFADYLVINVSSPNTPRLREMHAVELLRPLLADIRSELSAGGIEVPILIKIGPDTDNDQVDELAEFAISHSLDGIVAVNTTEDRSGLHGSHDAIAAVEGGGISGAPLKGRALEVLERLYAKVGNSLVLISVGGVETPQDAWQRILAGATLVQAYTGFVYGGPAWPSRMNRALARRVREAGGSSVQDLVGTGARRGGAVQGPGVSSGLATQDLTSPAP